MESFNNAGNRVSNFENKSISDTLQNNHDGSVTIKYGHNSGGYEKYMYYLTADGGVLAVQTVIDEIDQVNFNDKDDPQWYIVGVEVNYENDSLVDDHTGKLIESAYGNN